MPSYIKMIIRVYPLWKLMMASVILHTIWDKGPNPRWPPLNKNMLELKLVDFNTKYASNGYLSYSVCCFMIATYISQWIMSLLIDWIIIFTRIIHMNYKNLFLKLNSNLTFDFPLQSHIKKDPKFFNVISK